MGGGSHVTITHDDPWSHRELWPWFCLPSPTPRQVWICSNLDLTNRDSSLDIFKLVHYESHTVGKRAVRIRLECFLVIRIWTFRWQDNDLKDLCNFWCYRSLMVLECGVFPSFFRWDPSTSVWGSLILLVYCPGLHSWVFYDWSCKEHSLTTPRNRNIHYNISLRIVTGHEIKHNEPCD